MINKQSIKQFLKPNWKKLLIFAVICSISIYCIYPWSWYKSQYTLADRDDQGRSVLIKGYAYSSPPQVLIYSRILLTPVPLLVMSRSSISSWRQESHINDTPLFYFTLLFIWYYFFACLIFFCISKFSNIPKSKLISGIGLGVFATLISSLFVFLMYFILPFRAYEIASILVTIPYIVTVGRIFVMLKRETERELAPSFIITTIFLYNFFLDMMYGLAFC